MRRLASLVMTGLGLVNAACNPTPPLLYGDQPQNTGGTVDMAIPPPDLAESPYPAGPYGAAIGDTMFPLDLPGYRLSVMETDSTKVPWDDHLTLASVRSQSKAKCIVMAIDAFW